MSGIQPLIPLGQEQLTGLSTVKSLTVPAEARVALIQAETQNIRWRDDGTAPTSTVGQKLVADDDILYSGDLNKIQFLELAASAVVNVSYYTW